MTDYADLIQPDKGQSAHAIHLVDEGSYADWLKGQPERVRAALEAQNYRAESYAHAILPGDKPDEWSVLTCVANVDSLSSWCLAKLPSVLPPGTYRVESREPGPALFGWMTEQYRFDRYLSDPPKNAPGTDGGDRVLLTGEVAKISRLVAEAGATALVRDLVNAPAIDMGPDALEAEAETIAKAGGADFACIKGDRLEKEYPLIHAVGQAAMRAHAPRLIELRWGKAEHPKLAIVGKGVCFDSGGLDMKSSAGMRLMKKDMGGAAHALALAQLVMQANLPVRLHCLIPAVENAVAGNALRPGDIVTSRKGLTVEISNTDAEGRLVLADALTLAVEEEPELVIDYATLTGAARVALGPDLPALFARDEEMARALVQAGEDRDDSLWQLPLYQGYQAMLASDVADCVNAASGGFAGAITAALFLDRFVPEGTGWVHFDTYAWRATAKPGRPKGGEALGLRAAWHYLCERYAG